MLEPFGLSASSDRSVTFRFVPGTWRDRARAFGSPRSAFVGLVTIAALSLPSLAPLRWIGISWGAASCFYAIIVACGLGLTFVSTALGLLPALDAITFTEAHIAASYGHLRFFIPEHGDRADALERLRELLVLRGMLEPRRRSAHAARAVPRKDLDIN